MIAGGIMVAVFCLSVAIFLSKNMIGAYFLQRTLNDFGRENRMEISFDAISGNLISELIIRDLRIQSLPNGPFSLTAMVREVALHYSIVDLLKDSDVFIQGLSCLVTDAIFSYEAITGKAEDSGPVRIPDLSGLVLPRLEVINSSILYRKDLWQTEVKGFSCDMRPEKLRNTTNFSLQGEQISLRNGESILLTAPLELQLSLTPEKLEIGFLNLFSEKVVKEGWIGLKNQASNRFDYRFELTPFGSLLVLEGETDSRKYPAQCKSTIFL